MKNKDLKIISLEVSKARRQLKSLPLDQRVSRLEAHLETLTANLIDLHKDISQLTKLWKSVLRTKKDLASQHTCTTDIEATDHEPQSGEEQCDMTDKNED